MLKRSVDIALAGLLLVVSLPILVVAAIAIKLDSQGPVLFSQARMGLKFRRFRILKLRTMYAGIQGRAFTVCEDPRVTPTGHWLRWLKVDELPQLWNVICGEMSLVGPRPVVPELALEFEWAYSRLLDVRPGLTDPATLKYCREEEFLVLVADPLEYFKAVLTPDKLRISAAYLEHANVWSDLGVLAATALALVPGNWRPRFMRCWGAGQAEAAERMFREPAQGVETQGPIQDI